MAYNNSGILNMNRQCDTISGKGLKKRCSENLEGNFQKSKKLRVNGTSSSLNKVTENHKHENMQFENKKHVPHSLINFEWKLDLLSLWSLRKAIHICKYSSLIFEDTSVIKDFSDIVINNVNKFILVKFDCISDGKSNITYARLFAKEKRFFSLNSYFNIVVKHILNSSFDELLNNIDYLIIYTNATLELKKDKELKKGNAKNCIPFKFSNMSDENDIFKDILYVRSNVDDTEFYQFSKDIEMRKELYKRLEFSATVQKMMTGKHIPEKFEKKIKKLFLDKLVLATNQPDRKELNKLLKDEVSSSNIYKSYEELCNVVVRNLRILVNNSRLRKNAPELLYGFEILTSLVHSMLLHRNIFSMSFSESKHDTFNGIILNYRDRKSYIKTFYAESSIGYSQLFPANNLKTKSIFSLNNFFWTYLEELKASIRYFIIYTNVGLNVNEENEFKKSQTKEFYPFKFSLVNCEKKKYKIFKNCSCVNRNSLYKFDEDEETLNKLFDLLKLTPTLQRKQEQGLLTASDVKEVKKAFLNKLIFAVNQPNRKQLKNIVFNEVQKDKEDGTILYNYEELQEMILRWCESSNMTFISETVVNQLFDNLKNNNFADRQTLISENTKIEFNFAKKLIGKQEGPDFSQLFNSLVSGDGKKLFHILQQCGYVNDFCNILGGTGGKASLVFEQFYYLWFDDDGNQSKYLQCLEQNKIAFGNISNILKGAKGTAFSSYLKLHSMWFDERGNKTKYLSILEREGVNIAMLSNILCGASSKVATSFEDLFQVWFNKEGNKSMYLQKLMKENVSLSNVVRVLHGAGANSATTFKNLYHLWYDEEENETQCFQTLKQEHITLPNIFKILSKAGNKACTTFEKLYSLWFDAKGNKTVQLQLLERENIRLFEISNVLCGSGANAADTFEKLCNFLFDEKVMKKNFLDNLEENGISLNNIFSVLYGAGGKFVSSLKGFYSLIFDTNGNKTNYIKFLQDSEITLSSVFKILHGSGINAVTAFKNIYDFFSEDGQGKKNVHMQNLNKIGFDLNVLSNILMGSGINFSSCLKDLHDQLLDEEGNKTKSLELLSEQGVTSNDLVIILSGSGINAGETFKEMCQILFDDEGCVTKYFSSFKEENLNIVNIFHILQGAGLRVGVAFKELYNVWFDRKGQKSNYLTVLDKEIIPLSHMCSILSGAGVNSTNAFCELWDTLFDCHGNKTVFLRHFLNNENAEICFKFHNLSKILSNSGQQAKCAFVALHNACYTDQGEPTEILDDFLKAGFTLSSLSRILLGAGLHASFVLKKLHSLCFNKNRENTELLNDFLSAGFEPANLCNILSGAADSIKGFYKFCFLKDSKKYLDHFVKISFKPKYLCKILHGAGQEICLAFKELHNVCFDCEGNVTKILSNFCNQGFSFNDLSNLLSFQGSQAAFAFIKLHDSCFVQNNYLHHFLAEDLFSPKEISIILRGAGAKSHWALSKLFSICFKNNGKKTKYLKKLIISQNHNELCNTLNKKMKDLMD